MEFHSCDNIDHKCSKDLIEPRVRSNRWLCTGTPAAICENRDESQQNRQRIRNAGIGDPDKLLWGSSATLPTSEGPLGPSQLRSRAARSREPEESTESGILALSIPTQRIRMG